MQQLLVMAGHSGADLSKCAMMQPSEGLDYLAVQMSNSRPPDGIEYKLDGKFYRVLKRSWN